jgi:hypothetical protein
MHVVALRHICGYEVMGLQPRESVASWGLHMRSRRRLYAAGACYAFRNLARTDTSCMSPELSVILSVGFGLGSDHKELKSSESLGVLLAFITPRDPW